jgi:hypothetical protein
MALRIYSTIETDGPYPAVMASDVEMPDGKRLSEVEFGGGSLDMEALIAAVKGAVLDENDKIQEQYLPEEWVQRYVEEYIDEALGGEY